MNSSLNQHQAHQIDQLRGLAVLSVMAAHSPMLLGISIPFFSAHGGQIGVQLFFVLSGYLISESASRHPLLNYAIYRVFRIFPAYWFAYLLIGFLGQRFTWTAVQERPYFFILNLLNLQQLSAPALFNFNALGAVSWTLTIEILWYVLAPVLIWISIKKNLNPLIRMHLPVITMILISIAWVWLFQNGNLDSWADVHVAKVQGPPNPAYKLMVVNAAFPAQLANFAYGISIFFWREKFQHIPSILLKIIAFVLIAGLPFYKNQFIWWQIFSGIGITSLFMLAIRFPIVKIPSLSWIGKISYSLYLLHVALFFSLEEIFRHIGPWHVAITIALTVFSATLLHYGIELPGMRFSRYLTAKTPIKKL